MSLLASEQEQVHAAKLLKDMRHARERGRWSRLNYLTRLYLNSHAAKCVAVDRAYRKIKPHLRPDKAKLPEIARHLDAWKGTTEEVLVRLEPKASNPDDFRPICSFGIENRALQYLALGVLEQIANLLPFQYATRGPKAAITAVIEAMKNNGPMWAAEVDIKDCYPSFDGTKLRGIIPLPKEVIDHVIISKYLPLVPYQFTDGLGPAEHDVWDLIAYVDPSADARRGIPQGSAASNLVAEIVLALALKHVPMVGHIFCYADNVLLMATTEEDAARMLKALCSALEAHPVGRLRPRIKTFKPGEPIDFLGHLLTRKCGKVLIEPTPRNQQKFEMKVEHRLRSLKSKNLIAGARRAVVRKFRRYIMSWAAAFSLCDGVPEMIKTLKQKATPL